MRIPDSLLDQIWTEGFAILEGFLAPDELAEAQEGMFEDVPTPEDYFADPEAYRDVAETQFAGIRLPPYRSWAVNRLAFHPDLVDAAERFCGSTDLQLYKVELWPKYSGAVDYDQPHHRDYGNHNLVVPRTDGWWPQLTTFTLLSDVTEKDGPTKIIPRSVGDDLPLVPRRLEPGQLAEHEVPVVGPAGSILLYTTDVLHRGSAFTDHPRSRFMLLADYSRRGNPWQGMVSWPSRANHPGWSEMLGRMTVRERDLFGFPPPGHEYWNDQTIRDVGARFPDIDLTPYR